MLAALDHIDSWIFDLDNTLYPASSNLFVQVDRRMTAFIVRLLDIEEAEARRIQKQYFHTHGTTLAGLMRDHAVKPADFYDYVHDVDLELIASDQRMIDAIARLPGRRIVFTNGNAAYAHRVLARLGLTQSFEAVHDIIACDYVPKPDPAAYRSMCDALGVTPATSLFVDDMARNLAPAKALGMATAWVDNGSEQGPDPHVRSCIDHVVTDLPAWLEGILEEDG